jgi:hypothetical protein
MNSNQQPRGHEVTMNTKRLADTEVLRRTAARLERVGLVVDRTTLSRELRVAYYALQCLAVDDCLQAEAREAPLGFAYPNWR